MLTWYSARAYKMLAEDSDMLADARSSPPGIDNTTIGAILSATYGIPRRTSEMAVREALYRLDREQHKRKRKQQ